MGLSVLIILTCCNVVISAMRKVIPNDIRLAMFVVVIAGFVTIVDLLLQAYVPVSYTHLSSPSGSSSGVISAEKGRKPPSCVQASSPFIQTWAQRSTAVSYTHLDVYKRQISRRAMARAVLPSMVTSLQYSSCLISSRERSSA